MCYMQLQFFDLVIMNEILKLHLYPYLIQYSAISRVNSSWHATIAIAVESYFMHCAHESILKLLSHLYSRVGFQQNFSYFRRLAFTRIFSKYLINNLGRCYFQFVF